MSVTTQDTSGAERAQDDIDYQALRELIAGIDTKSGPLFTTSAVELDDLFLSRLPEDRRQVYNCRACRGFLNKIGGLVRVGPGGLLESVLMPKAGTEAHIDFFAGALCSIMTSAINAKITGVFLSADEVFGKPETVVAESDPAFAHTWRHLFCKNGAPFKHALLLPDQAAAERLEDFKMLSRALGEFSHDTVKHAVSVLKADGLERADKFLPIAEWLDTLYRMIDANRHNRSNIIWLAAATAPTGWAHVRSSMIGTLLVDLESLSVTEAARRWKEKMHPLQYQRPTAPVSSEKIDAAEKIVEKLGIARSLERRYARVEDVPAESWVWRPTRAAAPFGGGVFAHLRNPPRGKKQGVGGKVMTWVKFVAEVLPEAREIELRVPFGYAGYTALVTAVHIDAPPLLEWDREDKRNPLSWYLYVDGNQAHTWNLRAGALATVTGFVRRPGREPGVFMLLAGARDLNGGGTGFFPEQLRTELHGARAVLETHAKTVRPTEREAATACGLGFTNDKRIGHELHVADVRGVVTSYIVDRWD